MNSKQFKSGNAVALVMGLCLICSVLAGRASEAGSRVKTIRAPGVSKVVKAQIASDGTIHLLFDADDGPRYAKSTDGGATFSAPVTIVDAAAQKPALMFQGEDIAVGKEGRVHVAMSNNAWKLKLPEDQWGFYYASLAPGEKTFTPTRNINRKPSEGFALAADECGNVTVSFLSGKLYTMVSHDNGLTFTTYAEPNLVWNPCDCCTTASAYGADGRLALLYREETNNERDMYVALLDEKGQGEPIRTRVSGTPWKLNGCPMTYFTITRADTGYAAAWPTKGQVYFARLNQKGEVLPPGEIRTPGTSGMRMRLLALSANDGATLVAWKNDDVLGWQLYDAKGNPAGAPGSADSPGSGAAGAVLPNGNFILFL